MSLTYQEIKSQFEVLNKTAELIDREFGALDAFLTTRPCSVTAYIGSGSSYSVAKSLAMDAVVNLRRPAIAFACGDLLIHAKKYAPVLENALIVPVTRSGSTSEILLALQALKQEGCSFSTMSFICAENSPLAAVSDAVLEMPWAFDRSVCQTRTVTNLYFAGIYFNARLKGDSTLIASMKSIIAKGPAYMEKYEAVLEKLAAMPWSHAAVLADAEICGIAEEGALAFKEICQLNSNYYHVLDSRHGPMVMINGETLVVIAMSHPQNEFELKLIEDVKKKGALVVVYSDTPADIGGVANIVYGGELADVVRGIAFIPVLQLLACHKAAHTGVNPDSPEGLDAWIKI